MAETQAGKGALPFDHPSALGALGATGTLGANLAAREADVVLAVGTRLSDFTTASHTAFQDPGLRLIALNVSASTHTSWGRCRWWPTPAPGSSSWLRR